jgi:hypothetical protein
MIPPRRRYATDLTDADWQLLAPLIPGPSLAAAQREDHPSGGRHGYDGAKKVNGRKRHLLVDTLGCCWRCT